MSAKSERKAEIKAAKQAAYGKHSAWAQFKQSVADSNPFIEAVRKRDVILVRPS